jgi:CheY-like chemotaxis protein
MDEYGRRLPARLSEIGLLWERAQAGDDAALDALYKHAHQLNGSAGMYGYSELGEAARALDHALVAFRAESASLDAAWTERLGEHVAAVVGHVPAQASREAPEAPAAEPPVTDPASREQAVVLVADDDVEIRRLLCLYLEQDGLVTVAASDGREALELARAHRPDVVLMDLQMPEMDGFEAIEGLRADDATRDVPVIVLTAYDETDTVLRAFSLDVSGYLTKPTEVSEVVSKVFNVLISTG